MDLGSFLILLLSIISASFQGCFHPPFLPSHALQHRHPAVTWGRTGCPHTELLPTPGPCPAHNSPAQLQPQQCHQELLQSAGSEGNPDPPLPAQLWILQNDEHCATGLKERLPRAFPAAWQGTWQYVVSQTNCIFVLQLLLICCKSFE